MTSLRYRVTGDRKQRDRPRISVRIAVVCPLSMALLTTGAVYSANNFVGWLPNTTNCRIGVHPNKLEVRGMKLEALRLLVSIFDLTLPQLHFITLR
ncbi:hypothetical protein Q31a_28540 [Aureliella helgolandensis]|uniref:Uncharacterized protein n=1 Tax=Aureliella helgolandensis TaxID=2527968 RepID=A0A518G7H3_9BACT|nr:hypothetical protein Q31a_28540 [Aureliella helgolandensis]